MAAESMSLRDIFTWVFLTLFGGGIFVIYVPKGGPGLVAGLVMTIIGIVGVVVCAWPRFKDHYQESRPILTIGSLAALLWLLPLAAPEFIMHLHQRLSGGMGYLALGIIGAIMSCSAWWLYGMALTPARASTPENSNSPQAQGDKTNIQHSEGDNSPNISGNNNTVIITAPPATHPPKKGEKTSDIAEGSFLGNGFREATTELIHVRIGGYDTSNKKDWLKNGNLMRPLVIGPEHYVPISVGIDKNGKLLLNCELIGGDQSNPFRIKIMNNVFDVASGFVQKNYNKTALEIADDNGVPLLQVIQIDKNQLAINGVFMLGTSEGKPVMAWAWGNRYTVGITPPSGFALKPIFKYPSWKYLGQYAD
jgi:hypothetical protein